MIRPLRLQASDVIPVYIDAFDIVRNNGDTVVLHLGSFISGSEALPATETTAVEPAVPARLKLRYTIVLSHDIHIMLQAALGRTLAPPAPAAAPAPPAPAAAALPVAPLFPADPTHPSKSTAEREAEIHAVKTPPSRVPHQVGTSR